MENEIVISEFGLKWISDKVDTLKLDADDLKAKYIEKADEFTTSGIKAIMPNEDAFAEAICSALNAGIQREKGIPKMDIEFAPLGHYPERITRGAKASVEMIGIVKDSETGKKKLSRLQAWEERTPKKMDVEFGKGYTGTVKYIEEQQLEKAHVCGVEEFTEFKEQAIDWATTENINKILAKIPMVKLAEVAKNTSNLIEGNNNTFYSDSLDLKVIMGMVTDFKFKQKDDGSWWAKYSVVDSSFDDDKKRSFPIWVDKDLALRTNAGKDSFVRFVGTISEKQDKDTGDFVYDMSACAILPINIANGIDQPDEKILARQAQNAVPESEAGISIEDL